MRWSRSARRIREAGGRGTLLFVTTMPVRGAVWRSFYQDSMVLMRLAAELRERAGVSEAAALMGTPANHGLLAGAGLACPEVQSAGPADLMVALDASTETAAEETLAAAK